MVLATVVRAGHDARPALTAPDGASGPGSAHGDRRPTSDTGRPSTLRGEVVFAWPLGPRQVALDCLLRPPGRKEPLRPAHVTASGPVLGWSGTSLSDLVVRWLDDRRTVVVEVAEQRRHGARLRLTDGHSLIVLDVEQDVAVGAPTPAGS